MGSLRDDSLLGAKHTETLLEAVDTATGIQHFLLASVERVALGADVDVHVLGQRGTGLDDVAAAASGFDFNVIWMDIGFHGKSSRTCAATRPYVEYRTEGRE